jgi:hypothetical protein
VRRQLGPQQVHGPAPGSQELDMATSEKRKCITGMP